MLFRIQLRFDRPFRAVALIAMLGLFCDPVTVSAEAPAPHGFYGGALGPKSPSRQTPNARTFGPNGFELPPVDPSGHLGAGDPGQRAGRPTPRQPTPDEAAEALRQALLPKPTPAALRHTALDALFKRLAQTDDPALAGAIAGAIDRLWLRSDSPTATLLMERATSAVAAGQLPLAQQLLDRIVSLEPEWAEAWNKRATVRFLLGDTDGSMSDIDEVLRREPRHFGALTGMAAILRRTGFDAEALPVLEKVLALYPAQPALVADVAKLRTDVVGREL